MTIEDFKNIDATLIPPGKMISMAARGISIFVNHNLEKFDINATQLHMLFEISHENPINQEKIASRCNFNKGAVARSVKNLEDKGLIERQIDENNRRQNKVFITQKGEATLNEAIKLFDTWEEEVINKNQIIEKELLQKVLKEIVINTMELNARESKK